MEGKDDDQNKDDEAHNDNLTQKTPQLKVSAVDDGKGNDQVLANEYMNSSMFNSNVVNNDSFLQSEKMLISTGQEILNQSVDPRHNSTFGNGSELMLNSKEFILQSERDNNAQTKEENRNVPDHISKSYQVQSMDGGSIDDTERKESSYIPENVANGNPEKYDHFNDKSRTEVKSEDHIHNITEQNMNNSITGSMIKSQENHNKWEQNMNKSISGSMIKSQENHNKSEQMTRSMNQSRTNAMVKNQDNNNKWEQSMDKSISGSMIKSQDNHNKSEQMTKSMNQSRTNAIVENQDNHNKSEQMTKSMNQSRTNAIVENQDNHNKSEQIMNKSISGSMIKSQDNHNKWEQNMNKSISGSMIKSQDNHNKSEQIMNKSISGTMIKSQDNHNKSEQVMNQFRTNAMLKKSDNKIENRKEQFGNKSVSILEVKDIDTSIMSYSEQRNNKVPEQILSDMENKLIIDKDIVHPSIVQYTDNIVQLAKKILIESNKNKDIDKEKTSPEINNEINNSYMNNQQFLSNETLSYSNNNMRTKDMGVSFQNNDNSDLKKELNVESKNDIIIEISQYPEDMLKTIDVDPSETVDGIKQNYSMRKHENNDLIDNNFNNDKVTDNSLISRPTIEYNKNDISSTDELTTENVGGSRHESYQVTNGIPDTNTQVQEQGLYMIPSKENEMILPQSTSLEQDGTLKKSIPYRNTQIVLNETSPINWSDLLNIQIITAMLSSELLHFLWYSNFFPWGTWNTRFFTTAIIPDYMIALILNIIITSYVQLQDFTSIANVSLFLSTLYMSLEGTHTVWRPEHLSLFFIHAIHKFLLLFTMLSSMLIIQRIPLENENISIPRIYVMRKIGQKTDTPYKNVITKQEMSKQKIVMKEPRKYDSVNQNATNNEHSNADKRSGQM